jgi:hypothetical protein
VKILLTTNKFQQFAGAELVTLEIAEYFRAMGHECTIACWFAGAPLLGIARRLGVTVTDRPDSLNAFDFDLVWAHHHVAPVLRYEDGPDAVERTFFAWRHLSVVGRFEMPGLVLQDLICDRAYAVSEEARSLLAEFGMPEHAIMVFPNPAPDPFHRAGEGAFDRAGEGAFDRPALTQAGAHRPRSVLAVSNHAPPELLDALGILRAQGIAVRHVGRNGEGQLRVTPSLIRQFDAVVSIGKTVQYAMCCRRPAYVYDHFGGPGYLDDGNVSQAAWHNYSGRCVRRERSAAEIAQEIVAGYGRARSFAAGLPRSWLEVYRLEPYLERLLDAVGLARLNSAHRDVLARHQAMLRRERAFCAGAGNAFRGHQSFRRRVEAAQVA